MVWLRLEDNMLDHPKWRRAIRLGGDAAVGVWVRLVSWCSRNLTDGQIPPDMVEEVAETRGDRCRRRALEALISSSLVARDVHGACTIVDYLERNPSKSDVVAAREAARGRKEKHRLNSSGTPVSQRGQASQERPAATPQSQSQSPSHPNPLPIPSQDPPVVPQGTKPSKAKRAHRLPEDFAPTAEHQAIADEEGVELTRQFQLFCDHWRGNGKPKADWNATLRNWLRNANSFSGQRRPSKGQAPDDRLRAQADRVTMLRQREAAEEASRTGTQ